MSALVLLSMFSLTVVSSVKPLGGAGTGSANVHGALVSQLAQVDADAHSAADDARQSTTVMTFKEFVASQSEELNPMTILQEYETYKIKATTAPPLVSVPMNNWATETVMDVMWEVAGGHCLHKRNDIDNIINDGINTRDECLQQCLSSSTCKSIDWYSDPGHKKCHLSSSNPEFTQTMFKGNSYCTYARLANPSDNTGSQSPVKDCNDKGAPSTWIAWNNAGGCSQYDASTCKNWIKEQGLCRKSCGQCPYA